MLANGMRTGFAGIVTRNFPAAFSPFDHRSQQWPGGKRGRFGFDAGNKVQGACREGSQSR